MLYLCATPIGNLEDITLRVLRVLREVDVVAAEDTRHTRKLLSHYDIGTRLVSYHEHSSPRRTEELLEILRTGGDIALVSDAGMPTLSDPGAGLVAACRAAGLPVTCCPGPSALPTALALSGFDASQAVFQGFLPRGKAERTRRIEAMRTEARTTVIYESPRRLRATLGELALILEGRNIAVMTELTKLHESCVLGDIQDIAAIFKDKEARGEVVIVLEGIGMREAARLHKEAAQAEFEGIPIPAHVGGYTSRGMDKMQAIKAVAKDRGLPKSVVYNAMKEAVYE